MKKKILFASISILCILAILIIKNTGAILGVACGGNSVVIENCQTGEKRLITDQDDVNLLHNVFSGDYKQYGLFNENKIEYMVYFGNDLDTKLNSFDGYSCVSIISDKVYRVDDYGKPFVRKDIDVAVIAQYF